VAQLNVFVMVWIWSLAARLPKSKLAGAVIYGTSLVTMVNTHEVIPIVIVDVTVAKTFPLEVKRI